MISLIYFKYVFGILWPNNAHANHSFISLMATLSRREPLFTITSTLFLYPLTNWHTKLCALPWYTEFLILSYNLTICSRLHSWSALLLSYLISGTQPMPYGAGNADVYLFTLFMYQSHYIIIHMSFVKQLLIVFIDPHIRVQHRRLVILIIIYYIFLPYCVILAFGILHANWILFMWWSMDLLYTVYRFVRHH